MSMTAQPREPTGGSGVKAPKFSYVRAESVDAGAGPARRARRGGAHPRRRPEPDADAQHAPVAAQAADRHQSARCALTGISLQGDQVRIGALTRHVEVANSPIVAEHLPLIAEAMPHVAHVAVRNRGTFGGSIALADPAAEMPACALALGATFVVAERRRRREIAADGLFQGPLRDGAPARRAAGRGADPGAAAGCRVGLHGARAPARRFRHRRRCLPSGDRRAASWRRRGSSISAARTSRRSRPRRSRRSSASGSTERAREAAAAALAERPRRRCPIRRAAPRCGCTCSACSRGARSMLRRHERRAAA